MLEILSKAKEDIVISRDIYSDPSLEVEHVKDAEEVARTAMTAHP
ncbi:hypothetical protein ACFQJ5_10020 [Halomicroarcula sp. GCM10025324]|nr:hypothetical protein [Halomicroarcula sp. ZS-22-S1]